MKRTLFVLTLIIAGIATSQTTVYTMDFSSAGGFDHATSNPPPSGPQTISGANYILGYDAAPATDGSNNFFLSDGTKITSADFGGAAYFETSVINLSAFDTFTISGVAETIGGAVFNGTVEQFQWSYILNGGTPIQGPAITADGALNTPSGWANIPTNGATTLVVRFDFNVNGSGDGFDFTSLDVTGISSGGNAAPFISNINNTPDAPISSDTVSITASVSDTDGLASVELEYGFATGVYDQTPLAMTISSGDTYTATIAAQTDGITVYYRIIAIDSNVMPESTTSPEQSYTVMDPPAQGLQIDAVDTTYTIDFDTTVPNVNNGSFTGTGFAAVPTAGQLDANAFAITGLADATTAFGDEQSGNDFGKGNSNGGVSSGGIYAFEVAANDYALGIQPTGSDFTPGTIHFQFTNNTGATLTELALAYEVYFFNNETRFNDVTFSHGPDVSSLTEVASSSVASEEVADSTPSWERNLVAMDVTGLSIAAGSTYVLSWTSTDDGGGSSDEIALDNIQISANPVGQSIEAAGTLESITLLGNLNLNAATDVVGSLNLISGILTTNEHLTLKSSAGKTAIVAPVVSGSVNGDVSVEQFYSAQRAFRFVGAPVSMSVNVFDNWQQGGLNPGNTGYEPGVGTQITGGS
jgi:hypothetical protein